MAGHATSTILDILPSSTSYSVLPQFNSTFKWICNFVAPIKTGYAIVSIKFTKIVWITTIYQFLSVFLSKSPSVSIVTKSVLRCFQRIKLINKSENYLSFNRKWVVRRVTRLLSCPQSIKIALCCIQSKQRQVKTLTLQINMNKQESTVVPGNSLLVSSSS